MATDLTLWNLPPRRPARRRGAKKAVLERLLKGQNPEYALRYEMIEARIRAGWTQQELARKMGTTQSAIARLEGGRVSPNLATLKKLAKVTGSRLVVRLEGVLRD